MSTEPTSLRAVDDGDAQRPTRSPQRSRPDRGLPTDRLSFDAQQEVLRAFGTLSGPTKRSIDTPTLARAVSASASSAGLCNRFFVGAGWLERESKGKYRATDALLQFNRGRGQDGIHETDAVTHLADAASSAWFWQVLAPMLVDGPIPKHHAVLALSQEAGAGVGHEPQLENLLLWLEFIGLIQIEDGTVTAVESTPSGTSNDDDVGAESSNGDRSTAGPPAQETDKRQPTGGTVQKPTTQHTPRRTDFVLSFDVSFRMTAGDLAELSPDQIRALLEAVGQVAAATTRE